MMEDLAEVKQILRQLVDRDTGASSGSWVRPVGASALQEIKQMTEDMRKRLEGVEKQLGLLTHRMDDLESWRQAAVARKEAESARRIQEAEGRAKAAEAEAEARVAAAREKAAEDGVIAFKANTLWKWVVGVAGALLLVLLGLWKAGAFG